MDLYVNQINWRRAMKTIDMQEKHVVDLARSFKTDSNESSLYCLAAPWNVKQIYVQHIVRILML